MEKQPIDDLFARKLSDLEIKPNAKAFDLLKARSREKQSGIKWRYWAVAACLILIGLFSWWTTVFTSEPATLTKIERPAKGLLKQVGAEGRLAYGIQSQCSSGANTATNKPTEQKNAAVSRKRVLETGYQTLNKQLQGDGQQETIDIRATDKRESITATSKVTSAPLDSKEPLKTNISQASERTLIVTIEAPVPLNQAILEEVSLAEQTKARKPRLSVLLQKVKSIKTGDALALGANKTQPHGFGKLYEGVKESIRNNSID